MKERFNEIKGEILRRAHDAGACKEEYGRAYKAKDMAELCGVIKDNFWWCCDNKVLTGELVEKYWEEFGAQDIYVNVDVEKGFLLAWGTATVLASGTATVRAWDTATVLASGTVTVRAWGSATVRAWDTATVLASGTATVEATGTATVRAWGSATVVAWGTATVRASDTAYCTSYKAIDCKLSGHALYRVRETNTVYFASDDIEFVKI